MDIPFLETGIGLGGLLLANFGGKLGRVLPLAKQMLSYTEQYKLSKIDGKLTVKEKARLYDKLCVMVGEAWDIIGGWTPFKKI